jgi:hypothetical protein
MWAAIMRLQKSSAWSVEIFPPQAIPLFLPPSSLDYRREPILPARANSPGSIQRYLVSDHRYPVLIIRYRYPDLYPKERFAPVGSEIE